MTQRVATILHEIGPQHLTMKVLQKRLQSDFKIDFSEQKPLLEQLALDVMREPQGQKELAKAEKQAQEGTVNAGKGKRRGRSDTVKKDKTSDEKPPKKARKEKRAEGEPVRPQSAYFFFSNEKRPIVMAETGEKMTEVAKRLGETWQSMSEAAKAPYVAMAATAKTQFDEQMSAFIKAGGKPAKSSRASKKAKDDGPKKPLSAYFHFTNAKRAEVVASGIKDVTDVSRKIGQLWGETSDKSKWDAAAMKDYERFKRECEALGLPCTKNPPKPSAASETVAAASASSSSSSSDSESEDE